eukprot:2380113-Amphidinium_carterae.1
MLQTVYMLVQWTLPPQLMQGAGKNYAQTEALRKSAVEKVLKLTAGYATADQVQASLRSTQTCTALCQANTELQTLQCFVAALRRAHYHHEAATIEQQ